MAQTTTETKQSKQATLFKAKDYNIMIGVDPGSITGVCVWDPGRGKILDMQSMSHIKFMEWVLTGNEVYDMVLEKRQPKKMFYSLIHPRKLKKYTQKEAMKKMLETKHFGRWEVKFKK